MNEHDPESYLWQEHAGRVFCMKPDGQILFALDRPRTWKDAMLGAFMAGRAEEAGFKAEYVQLLESLCTEMLPDAFRPLDQDGIDLLVEARDLRVERADIQRMWDELQAEIAQEQAAHAAELKRLAAATYTQDKRAQRAAQAEYDRVQALGHEGWAEEVRMKCLAAPDRAEDALG